MCDFMGLLEDLKEILGCNYISDLHYGGANKRAKKIMRNMDLSEYSPAELSDAASYLCERDIRFETAEEAKEFFS